MPKNRSKPKKSAALQQHNQCWCGGPNRAQCCEPILNGQPAPTPEALMRSRYSAYVTANEAYLRSSWHPATRPSMININPNQRWLGLKIKQTSAPDTQPNAQKEATVEFVARYKIDGRGFRLHEHSRFTKHNDRWVYLDGELIE